MINAAIQIIDRLISLIKVRETNKRKFFEDHIEPIFLDMTIVHKDYNQSFRRILNELGDNNCSPSQIKETVSIKKSELEHLRVKVRAFAKVFTEDSAISVSEEAHNFYENCLLYLKSNTGDTYRGHSQYTTLIDFLSVCEGNSTFSRARKLDLASAIKSSIYDVNQRWCDLTEAYAIARAKLL